MNYIYQLDYEKVLVENNGELSIETMGYPLSDCTYNGVVGQDEIMKVIFGASISSDYRKQFIDYVSKKVSSGSIKTINNLQNSILLDWKLNSQGEYVCKNRSFNDTQKFS